MKEFMTFALLLMSVSAFAETRITGKDAENLFNSLEGQYEYTSGAKVRGLSIETIVRHDNEISCQKEIVEYSGALATISYECIVKE
nr:hypothetical protein BHI3_28940 [Bacteriovorax sp. HI3]